MYTRAVSLMSRVPEDALRERERDAGACEAGGRRVAQGVDVEGALCASVRSIAVAFVSRRVADRVRFRRIRSAVWAVDSNPITFGLRPRRA